MNGKYAGCCCAICAEDDPRVLREHHHLFGKASSPETLLICFNCHAKITQTLNQLSPKVRSAKNTDKRAYIDVTVGVALELFGKYMKERGLKYGDRSKGI